MSPALLTKRLRTLERADVITRTEIGGRSAYSLTEKGQELAEVVGALSAWGTRWISELGDADLDPHLLMWDMRRTVPVDRWLRRRTVVAFEFRDIVGRARRWWMVVCDGEVDVCDVDPGYDVDAAVTTDLRTLTEIWRGDTDWGYALRAGEVEISGSSTVRADVPGWMGQSLASAVPRPA